MRIPANDGAGQRSPRRFGRGASPGSDQDTADQAPGGRDGTRRRGGSHAGGTPDSSGFSPSTTGTGTNPARHSAWPARSGSTGRGDTSADGSSVFAPGYDGNGSAAAGPGRPGAPGSSWYGSAAGGAAGKGPVRGYPPAPGQPAPMYPPGQFAAWNLGQDGRSAGSQQGGDRELPARARRDSGQPDQASRPAAQAAEAGARYYDGSGAEPGYSVLAVSDPAADVTSTQTWEAVGDGRSTGTWTAPARPGAGPDEPDATRRARSSGPRQTSGRHSAPPDVARPGAARPEVAPRDFARSDTALPDPAWPVAAEPGTVWPGATQPGTAGRDDIWPDSTAAGSAWPAGLDRASRGHSGPDDDGSAKGPQRRDSGHSGPQATARSQPRAGALRTAESEPGPAPGKRSGTPKRSAGSNRPGGGKRSSRRNRPASVKLAMAVALLLVLTAAGTLAYTVLHNAAKPKPLATANTKQPKVTPSASPSPSLGPYGHIASRQSDPQALTVAQLFPASFTVGGKPVTLTASAISRRCGGAVTGSSIQSAVGSAHCDQAVRATYLSTSQGLMGTVGVLNLSTAARAAKAAKAADAGDFISQLKGKRGPTRKIGNGTGIEEALAKGHYLILIWAEFTSLRKPRTAAERTRVEDFMTELLDNTANVSLTTRMLTGTA